MTKKVTKLFPDKATGNDVLEYCKDTYKDVIVIGLDEDEIYSLHTNIDDHYKINWVIDSCKLALLKQNTFD